MIAVLIDARMPGSSGWVAVRHARKIKVSGTTHPDDDYIKIHYRNNGRDEYLALGIDTEIDIPSGVERLRAEILKVGEGSRISIDLE